MPLDSIPVRVRILPAVFSLVIVVVLWFGFAGVIALAAIMGAFDVVGATALGLVCAVAIVVVWLVVGALLLLYVAFDAWRYTFGRTELRVLGWRGRRLLPWSDVQSARVVASRFGVALMLTFAAGRRVRIPLLDYYNSGRLVADIEARLPVAVSAPQRLKEHIERSDRSSST